MAKWAQRKSLGLLAGTRPQQQDQLAAGAKLPHTQSHQSRSHEFAFIGSLGTRNIRRSIGELFDLGVASASVMACPKSYTPLSTGIRVDVASVKKAYAAEMPEW
jgi:hypothetical protein